MTNSPRLFFHCHRTRSATFVHPWFVVFLVVILLSVTPLSLLACVRTKRIRRTLVYHQ
jgi:hypothetical protein